MASTNRMSMHITPTPQKNARCPTTPAAFNPARPLTSYAPRLARGATLHQAHGENRGGDHPRIPITQRRRMAVWIRGHGKGRMVLTMRPLLALAAIYSRGTCRPTTIDVLMFHFRVRNGTGWGHQAVTTRFRRVARFALRRVPGGLAGLVCVNVRSFRDGEDWHPHGRWDVQCTKYNVQCRK